MMKTKRLIAIVLGALMTLSCFSGCGGGSGTAGSGANELMIGGAGPLTGSTAIYGIAVKKGAELAINEINEAGGVNGITFKLNFQDDENDAQKSVNAYNKCVDDGCKVFLGPVTSIPCVSVVEEAASNNMFLITPSATAKDCISSDNAVRVCFNDPNQGNASAQYIADNNLAKKIAVIYDSSDVYSSGIYETFDATAKEKGLEIVSVQSFTSSNNTDFSVALQKISESGAELVYLPFYYQQAALVIQQAAKAGYDFKYFGCDGLDGLVKQLDADADLADGVMLLTGFAPDASDEKSQAFVSAYEAAYDETPTQFAAASYDAIYAIKAALEKADISDASISASDLCDEILAVMTQITVEGVTGTITWGEDGEPNKDAKAVKIVDGAYQSMD